MYLSSPSRRVMLQKQLCQFELYNCVPSNLVVQLLFNGMKNTLLTTSIEPLVSHPFYLKLCNSGYIKESILPFGPCGEVLPSSLDAVCSKNIGMLSLPLVNPLTGVIEQADGLSAICRAHGIIFHSDISNAIGKIPINFDVFDAFTVDGYGIFVSKSIPFVPIDGNAMDYSKDGLISMDAEAEHTCMEVGRCRDFFEAMVMSRVNGAHVVCNGADRIATVSTISFPRVHGELMAFYLVHFGIKVTTMAHISLEEMLTTVFDGGAITVNSAVSFSFSNVTMNDIEYMVDTVVKAFDKCDKISRWAVG